VLELRFIEYRPRLSSGRAILNRQRLCYDVGDEMTGGEEMSRLQDLNDMLMECSEHLARVDCVWSDADDEERIELRSLLVRIELQLQSLIEARDVPWGAFRQAMQLMAHVAHSLNLVSMAEYTGKLSRLERKLRAAATDEGWDAYLEIDTLKSDEAARRATRRCPCACAHGRYDQFMTSRSS